MVRLPSGFVSCLIACSASRNGDSRARRAAAPLLLIDLKGIAILHLEPIGGIGSLDPFSVEEKADGAGFLSVALAEDCHELLQLGRFLDLEHELVVIIGDLDVQVLGLRGCLLALCGRGVACVLIGRHRSHEI